MSKNVKAEIKIRRDTSTSWETVNPVLGEGEIAYESDTHKLKVGDGITTWKSLPYSTDISEAVINSLAKQVTLESVETKVDTVLAKLNSFTDRAVTGL